LLLNKIHFFKDKYKEFRKVGEDIQYFGNDNIKKGDRIEITPPVPFGLTFIFKEFAEQFYFWGGKYKFLKDREGNEIGNDLDSKIVILNKSYVLISKKISRKGEQQLPAEEPTKVTLDKILYLKKASDYSKMPSETL